jgi:membrane-bound lytic murein transglycosylase D
MNNNNVLRQLVIVISIIFGAYGCQTMEPATVDQVATHGIEPNNIELAPDLNSQSLRAEAEKPAENLWVHIREQLQWQTLDNEAIAKARDQLLRQNNYLPVMSERAAPYLHYIVGEIEKRDMPIEIALLPMVESGYNPYARSSQSATGLWQIMPATGRYLGLESNWWYDGKRDLRESTQTALDYLEHLHTDFNDDWLLALAAYNSGKGRVRRAQRANEKKGLATDYWSLSLPGETRRYIPKLIALSGLVAFPDAYGLTIPPIANQPAFSVVETGGQIELAKAAALAEIDLESLRALNPGQLRWATSPEQAAELLVPVGHLNTLEQGIAGLTDEDRVRWEHYRIEQGDSLIKIAKQFDTEVGLLRQVNHIRGNLIRAGKTLMIPSGNAWATSLAMAEGKPRAKGYRVRRGDSLYVIAGKFNVTIGEIIDWNALNREAYLQPGQNLTLWVTEI